MWKQRSEARRLLCGIGAACLFPVLVCSGASTGLPSREEALAAVYPAAQIRAERVFLTEQQRGRAADLSQVRIPSPLIARYLAIRAEQVVGRAYVDTHVVRTKKESLLICLDASGKVRRIEVTAFLEPREYMASQAWYSQYTRRGFSDASSFHRSIRPIIGATLTSSAANEALRRVLAIDQVLQSESQTGE